ncbi:MAG: hypothetical protein VX730_07030 [Pseudomonadota bacterium]|nr:hypothetical protein [Pseudomonadota bacterium]
MTLMKPVPMWAGDPLLPHPVENYWGKLTEELMVLAFNICEGTEGLGPLIDEGSIAHVFEVPRRPDLVVKITQEFDDGYAKWLEQFVLINQDNPHVPKVVLHMRLNNGQSVTIMERLTPFDDADPTVQVTQQRKMLLTIADELGEGKMDAVLDLDMPEGIFEILDFLSQFNTDWLTIEEKNAMFRGETLVFTDPMI